MLYFNANFIYIQLVSVNAHSISLWCLILIFLTQGHFCENTGLSNVSGPCDAGYYCLRGAKSATPKDNTTGNICPKGHFCLVGTSDPIKCPLGKYSNASGNEKETDCRPCVAGKYCGALGLEEPSGDCDPGFYCPGGQSSRTPSGYICTPGHYCPSGSPSQRPCASGSYQDEYQRASCKSCPEGFYCDATLMNVTHCVHSVQLPSPCPAGHYCLSNTKFATQYPCPNGKCNFDSVFWVHSCLIHDVVCSCRLNIEAFHYYC